MPELEPLLDVPRLQAADAVVADLQLRLRGVDLPWQELGGVLDEAHIHGAPDLVRLRVPSTLADPVRACGRLVITDRESSPTGCIADARVESGVESGVGELETWVLGRPEPCGAPPALVGRFDRAERLGPFGQRPSAGGPDRGRLLVICQRPLLTTEVALLRSRVADGDDVLIIVSDAGPTPDHLPHRVLWRCLESDLPEIARESLPIAWREQDSDLALAGSIATATGAEHLQVVRCDEPGWRQLAADLDRSGDSPHRDRVSTKTWAHLTRWRAPRSRRGLVVFFTGLSGSGKSTLARALVDRLATISDRSLSLLDGDEVRRLLSSGLGFDRGSRDLNIQRIGFVASEIARSGGIAVCAPIAPYAAGREEVRTRVAPVGDLIMVHVATPLEVCERRDVKGLYAQARAGLIAEFTGVSDPYEAPTDAEVTIDTSRTTPEEAVDVVLDYLRQGGWLSGVGAKERSAVEQAAMEAAEEQAAEEQAWTG